jgi:Family of unknown function (DUF6444)
VSMTPAADDHRPEDHAADVSDYRALVAELRAQNAGLLARVAELERQLGLNSGNSGKPPSSDGLKKKPVRVGSLGERTGKKPGGQKGHPGKTLSRTESPDATVEHFPKLCAGCGAALSEAMATGHAARQVFDLPEPQPPTWRGHLRPESLRNETGGYHAGDSATKEQGPRLSRSNGRG